MFLANERPLKEVMLILYVCDEWMILKKIILIFFVFDKWESLRRNNTNIFCFWWMNDTEKTILIFFVSDEWMALEKQY